MRHNTDTSSWHLGQDRSSLVGVGAGAERRFRWLGVYEPSSRTACVSVNTPWGCGACLGWGTQTETLQRGQWAFCPACRTSAFNTCPFRQTKRMVIIHSSWQVSSTRPRAPCGMCDVLRFNNNLNPQHGSKFHPTAEKGEACAAGPTWCGPRNMVQPSLHCPAINHRGVENRPIITEKVIQVRYDAWSTAAPMSARLAVSGKSRSTHGKVG
jgi:hypothetical protein